VGRRPHCFKPGATGGPEAALLAVCGVVEESMLFGPSLRLTTRIWTRVGSNGFTIDDEVVNLRGVDGELQMLYHCNFGPPFLEAGARLLAPSVAVAPRDARAAEGIADYATCLGPTPGYVEQVYYHDLAGDADGMTAVALVNAAGDKAVVLRFTRESLPCFAQWKNTIPLSDGYVTGLEPGTNYPNAKPFERAKGRVVRLPPGGGTGFSLRRPVGGPHRLETCATWRARLRVEVLDSTEAVAAFEREVGQLTAGRARKVHGEPLAGWSPR
jgi:hypothetical protein